MHLQSETSIDRRSSRYESLSRLSPDGCDERLSSESIEWKDDLGEPDESGDAEYPQGGDLDRVAAAAIAQSSAGAAIGVIRTNVWPITG